MSAKIKKRVSTIVGLKEQLAVWKQLPETEVFDAIKNFEKTTRWEGSKFYKDLFCDEKFARVLLAIGEEYKNDDKLTVNVISSLGYMMERYNLIETYDIYNYFESNMYRKKVAVNVSLFIVELDNFKNFQNKWEYIMNIKNMKPAKIAKSSFESIIKQHECEVPLKYYDEIHTYFMDCASNCNNEAGRDYYVGVAGKFVN